MNRPIGTLLVAAGVLAAASALAVPPAITIEFDGNGEGVVTFRGRQHTGPGMHCSDCHFELFDTSRSAQITKADHRRRHACFTCHDGKVAFAPQRNCDRCHVEPEPPVDEATAVTDAQTAPATKATAQSSGTAATDTTGTTP